jgi:hypothetical protein
MIKLFNKSGQGYNETLYKYKADYTHLEKFLTDSKIFMAVPSFAR